MAEIVIYSTSSCIHCERAKNFFETNNLKDKEIRVDLDPEKLSEMLTLSNGYRTVPQIFINKTHIGGNDKLMELHSSGELEKLLN